MDAQRACIDDAVLVALAAGQDKDVLPALVKVHGHAGLLAEADEGGGWPRQAVAIEPIDVHAITKVTPGNVILLLKDVEDVLQLKMRETEAGG